ncbi:GH25 family lysozyme [Sphingobium subterraneum]|uniref:Lysozyme n=1 Tax=Sphingobium subterraneum TaxID=627688 RepID=A0A841J1X3_9SPHN|nr:GH25 family lysozyme [Sphingobium subterraneum]MBB6122645.1 lysozyme [Sphingobium subterraneum]
MRRSRRPSRTRLLIAGLAVLATLAGILWFIWTRWTPSQDRYPVQGISVSERQGEIEWRTVRTQGADFAYIRATTGVAHRDPRFAANWAGAREAGLRYGAELAFDLCKQASDQATSFITTVPRDNAALPPAIRLDFMEGCGARPSRDTVLSELNTLLNLVEAYSGKPALLRVSERFDAAYDLGSGINRTLWLEGNLFPPDYATRPWVMWTASDAHRMTGVSGPVDWNVVAP